MSNDNIPLMQQYQMFRQTPNYSASNNYGITDYSSSNPAMFDYRMLNSGGYFDNRLVQKQSNYLGMPFFMNNNPSNVSPWAMSANGGNEYSSSPLLNMLLARKYQQLETQNPYREQVVTTPSYGYTEELNQALSNVAVQYPYGTGVDRTSSNEEVSEETEEEQGDTQNEEIEEKSEVAKDEKEVKKEENTEVNNTQKRGFSPEVRFGLDLGTGFAVGMGAKGFNSWAFQNASGISTKDYKRIKTNVKSGSAVSNLASETKALEEFKNIGAGKLSPEEWIKQYKFKAGNKSYSFEELKELAAKDFKGLNKNQINQAKEALNNLKVAENAVEPYKSTLKGQNNLKATGSSSSASNNQLVKNFESAQAEVVEAQKLMKEAKTKKLPKDIQLDRELKYKAAVEKLNSSSKALEESLLKTTKAGVDVAKSQSSILKNYKGKPDDLVKHLEDIIKNGNATPVEKEAAKILKERTLSAIKSGSKPKEILSFLTKRSTVELEGLESTAKIISKAGKAGKLASLLGKAGKAAGPIGYALVAASEGLSIWDVYQREGHFGAESTKKLIRAAASTAVSLGASVWAGTAGGAAIGTACGLGVASWATWAIGAVIGAGVGLATYYLTDAAVSAAADAFVPPDEKDLEIRNGGQA